MPDPVVSLLHISHHSLNSGVPVIQPTSSVLVPAGWHAYAARRAVTTCVPLNVFFSAFVVCSDSLLTSIESCNIQCVPNDPDFRNIFGMGM